MRIGSASGIAGHGDFSLILPVPDGETLPFGFKRKNDCTIRAAKTKALISCVVTAQLICGFVFAYANYWFSHAMTHLYVASAGLFCVLVYILHLNSSLK